MNVILPNPNAPYPPPRKYVMVNVFRRGHWRLLALLHISLRPLIWPWVVLGKIATEAIFAIIKVMHREDTIPPHRLSDIPLVYTKEVCLAPSWAQPMLSFIWWTMYFLFYSTDRFLQEFIQTWHEELSQRGTVVWLNIFVSDQHLCVPISFDSGKEVVGTDRQTFEALHMWYSLMRVKRGLSEIILPRRLVRVDKVGLCRGIRGTIRLGGRLQTFGLGRHGSGQVANLVEWWTVGIGQRYQTEAMVANASTEGLEFIRAWDSLAVSLISLVPFGLSLLFAAVWIGVSIRQYGADAQVATQTAFTVAAYIVTAGALLIALFAFLDSQAQNSP